MNSEARATYAIQEWRHRGCKNVTYFDPIRSAAVRDLCSVEEPPKSFASGPFATNALRVYYLEYANQYYWIFDHKGFLCSTSSVEALTELLRAEARPWREGEEPRYGAREIIDPGFQQKVADEAVHLKEVAKQVAKNFAANRKDVKPPPAGEGVNAGPADGAALLNTLGLL